MRAAGWRSRWLGVEVAGDPDAEFVDMVFLLHTCPFGELQAALAEIEKLDSVNSAPVVFRIEALK